MAIFNHFLNFNTSYLGANLFSAPQIFNSSFNPFMGFNMPMFSSFNFFNTPISPFNSSFQQNPYSFPQFNFNFNSIFPTDIWKQTNSSNSWNNFSSQQYSWNQGFNVSNISWGDTFTKTSNTIKRNPESSNLQLELVNKAKSYVGKVNSDAEGNRLFSNGKKQAWCADFVSTVTRDTIGSNLPSSFQHFSAVSDLRKWGQNNNCYLEVPNSNKADFIAKNVKVGDIMIEKDSGKSHTGIVTKVNSDGSFETVEGNCGNKVATRKYTANSPTLSGFVSLDKYVA